MLIAGMLEPCVATDEIAAMIAGDLGADRVEMILVHIDRCAVCSEVMANLGQLEGSPADVGRYEIGRVLGSGAMGIVYDAWDPQLRRRVALKVVRPEHSDAASHARMLREARALARVSHPNVVGVYDISEHGGRLCVATELVDGETLADWQLGRAPGSIVDAWLQAAHGLAAAHAVGVVHRDVKPSNVLVGRDGRVRVGDFGLARMGGEAAGVAAASGSPAAPAGGTSTDARVTATGFIAGTPAYMAPEQGRGIVDARSDQFALCVALGEALLGHRPAANDQPTIAGRPALSAVLARGLREAPGERFETMDALADALAAADAPPVPARSRTGLIALAAAGAIAVGGSIAWFARPAVAACVPATLPDDLLSPARRASLERALPAGVIPRVDRWLTSWSAAARDVCTVDRDDATLRTRRDRCLAEAALRVQSVVGRWEAGLGRDPLSAHTTAVELPAVSHCSHTMQQSAGDPTAAQAIQIVPVRIRLQGARTEQPPLDALRALASDALAVGYAPLATEVAVEAARLENDSGRARRVLRDAMALADAHHATLAQAESRIALIERLDGDPAGETAKLADDARTLLSALGGDPVLEAVLDFCVGAVMRDRGQHDKAVALFERSAREFRAVHGPDGLLEAQALVALSGALAALDPNGKPAREARDAAIAIYQRAHVSLPLLDQYTEIGRDPERLVAAARKAVDVAEAMRAEPTLASAEFNLANAYILADHLTEALEHYQRTIAINDKLGIKIGSQAGALSQAAWILREQGRPREAIPLARRSAAVAEAISDDSELAASLTMLGGALLDAHDPRGARAPLQRALAIRDRLHEPARFRGNTRFLLAMALWSSDHARARDLAHAARVDIQSFIDGIDPSDPARTYLTTYEGTRLAKIDSWLASHR